MDMSASPVIQPDAGIRLELAPHRAIKQLEDELGLSGKDLAGALNIGRRTLERWLTGETYPRREARRQLAVLLALNTRLRDTFADLEAARTWLHGPNRYLGGIRSIEALRTAASTESMPPLK
jgi:transcriptional regulator with XRE-family HTH domain